MGYFLWVIPPSSAVGGQEELLGLLSVRLLADFLTALPLRDHSMLPATQRTPLHQAAAEGSPWHDTLSSRGETGREMSEAAGGAQSECVSGSCEEAKRETAEAAERWQLACTEILPQVGLPCFCVDKMTIH